MVPFLDLKKQYAEIKDEVNAAVMDVIESTQFVLGDEVKAFEDDFAVYCTSAHCVAFNSGTSALHLALLALEIGPGDEVITVSNTAVPTVSAILETGAKPVFCDVNLDDYNIDTDLVENLISKKTKAVVCVHLYGHAANVKKLQEICKENNLFLVEDLSLIHI